MEISDLRVASGGKPKVSNPSDRSAEALPKNAYTHAHDESPLLPKSFSTQQETEQSDLGGSRNGATTTRTVTEFS